MKFCILVFLTVTFLGMKNCECKSLKKGDHRRFITKFLVDPLLHRTERSCSICCPNGGEGTWCSCAPCQCFPYDSRVTLENQDFVKMSELQVGDKVQADEMLIGDEVLVQENDQINPVNIINISDYLMQGAYVPLTMEGNMLVDAVLASCYPSTNHDLANIAMKPVQMFPELIEWIFGIDNGFTVYAKVNEDLWKWVQMIVYV